jgi:modulator of FtsH protease
VIVLADSPASPIAIAEAWHDFFLLAGTAAVTLVGLLFVALSFNLDALLHDSRQHLLRLARSTLLSFVVVLVLSLAMLAPSVGSRPLGVQLITLGIVAIIASWRQLVGQSGDPGLLHGEMRMRRWLPLIAFLSFIGVGFAILRGHPDFMLLLVGSVGMLLGNATGVSWDLLVRVGKAKREMEREAATAAKSAGA